MKPFTYERARSPAEHVELAEIVRHVEPGIFRLEIGRASCRERV